MIDIRRGARPTHCTPRSKRIRPSASVSPSTTSRTTRLSPPRTGCAANSTTCRAPPGCTRRPGRAARRQGRVSGLRAPDVAVLRSMGIPARYVSGYLHPQRKAADRRDRRRSEPRLDPGLDRRLVELRPHQRHRDQRAIHQRRRRPRLRRRHALKGIYSGGGSTDSTWSWRSPGWLSGLGAESAIARMDTRRQPLLLRESREK